MHAPAAGDQKLGAANDSNRELEELLKGRDTRFYRGHLGKLNLIILLLLITSATNGYDGSMMNGLQTLNGWQAYFNNPTGSLLGIFNAIQSIGGIASLPFAPIVADRYGRRTGIFLGSCLMLIGTAIQTGAQDIGMFIGKKLTSIARARFLIGFGLGFACLAAPILITELAFPTHRAQLTSLYNSSWYLGSIIAAWATFGTFRINNTWSWRVPSLLQGLPSVFQFFLIYLIPESPRWLINHGKEEQAARVIAKYHCGGDLNDPLIDFEMTEMKEAIRLEKEAASSSGYKDLFATAGNRRRMAAIIGIAFFSQWSGNGIVSYYFNIVLKGIGITRESQKTLLNGILQVYNYATAIFGALMVERLGRRTLFLTSGVGMCLSYMCWTICSARYANTAGPLDNDGNQLDPSRQADTAAGKGVLGFIFIYYAFYNIAMSPLLVSYTVEILPFRIRAKGLMVMNLCVNCSLVFNQYANPIALGALGWKYYIVYTCWIAFEVVYMWFTIRETKGKDGPLPLEEIAALFDKEDTRGALTSAAHGAVHGGVATPPGTDEKIDDKISGEYVETVPRV